MYYDRSCRPIQLSQWVWSGIDRRVAEDTLPNGYWIGTVWLGIDCRGYGPPLIFETMVLPHFGTQVCSWDVIESDRYSTEAAALAGHRAMVDKFTAKVAI